MARIQNKLIFTEEGNRLLVSQVGGIKFAILGGFLVQGKEPCVDPEELKEKYFTLTLEELLEDKSIVIGLKGITYVSQGNDKVLPKNEAEYNAALKEIDKHLFGTYYIPTLEYKKGTHHFGAYDFDFDKTDLSMEWNQSDESVSFSMFCLVGKQYTETDDAVFNVDKNQNPSIVAVAQVLGDYDETTSVFNGGIQFLKEQNQYLSYKLRLIFSLTDDAEDSTASFEIDEDAKNAIDNIQLVNKGLKANQLGITVADEYIDDVGLNRNGSFATTRSLMVADNFVATEYENQFNAAGLVHLLNKKNDEKYMEQVVLTSLEEPTDLTSSLTAYNVGMLLRGTGEYVDGRGSTGPGPKPYTQESNHSIPDYNWYGNLSPSFTLNALPETDNDNLYTVDIFGIDNIFIGNGNADKSLFSQKNVSLNPMPVKSYGYVDDTTDNAFNVTIQSNENLFYNANTNNTLIKSNGNYFGEKCHSNIILGGDKNIFNMLANNNVLLASDNNYLEHYNTHDNILIGGHDNVIDTIDTIVIGGIGINATYRPGRQLIFGQYNAATTASIVYGIGTDDSHRRNALEFDAYRGVLKLFDSNGTPSISIGGNEGIDVNNLNLESLTASNILATNITASNNISVGQTLNAMNITAARLDVNDTLKANYLESPLAVRVTDNGSLSATIALADDHCGLNISDNHNYLQYDTGEGSFTVGHNKSNPGNLSGWSVDNGLGALHLLRNQDTHSNIYLNETVYANGNVGYAFGNFEIYHSKPEYNKKIKLTPEGIEFLTLGVGTAGAEWQRTNYIPSIQSYSYSKIKADIYIWGTDMANWSYNIYNFKGTQSQLDWLTTIFKKTPILTYGFKSDEIPNAENAIVWVNDGVSTGLCYIGDEYRSNVDAVNAQVLGLQYKCNFGQPGGSERTYVVYTQVNPDGVDPFDELEINLHIHSWGDDRPFSLNWVPLTTNYNYSPVIKLNIISDVTTNSNRTDFYAYLNKNWEETMVFDKLSKKPCSVYAGSGPYAPTLQCTVPHGTISNGFLRRSNNSPFLFGWDVLGG